MARRAAQNAKQPDLFPSRFEDEFFFRTLGDIVRVPDVALSELVANTWDAGAAKVSVTIPDALNGVLSVEDDGCGLTKDEFFDRWMTLAYNRQKHQGSDVEFPPERSDWRRKAYGRNGQGRHGLLCFGDAYNVDSWRDGTANDFALKIASGKDPLVSELVRSEARAGHGTKVSVVVVRRLPDPDRIREVLASKFLHDPNFTVFVNGTSLPLAELPGLTEQKVLVVKDPESSREIKLELIVVEGDAGRTKHQSGVAFWVGGRLVGEPGWAVGSRNVLDGRTRPGRRLTVVVKTGDLFDEILPDWSGFKRSPLVEEVFRCVVDEVQRVLTKVLASRIKETTDEVLADNRASITTLGPSARLEVVEVVDDIAQKNPLLSGDAISAAVKSVVRIKQKTDPRALAQRVLSLPEEDIEGLARLLDEWTVRDALTVLDEIGLRIKAVEALEKLMGDKNVDEVHIIHPLVTQARWLFGPEFESPLFSSNVTLRTAVKQVFGKTLPASAFDNAKKRPDLLFLPNGTLSAVATERVNEETGLATLESVLLVELKKGGSKIGRDEMNQAEGYIDDILHCGLIDGPPYIDAVVVGHGIDPRTTPVKTIGEKPEKGRVRAVTFSQLVRTANLRLFRIRDQVQDRYPETGRELLARLSGDGQQLGLLDQMADSAAHAKVGT